MDGNAFGKDVGLFLCTKGWRHSHYVQGLGMGYNLMV